MHNRNVNHISRSSGAVHPFCLWLLLLCVGGLLPAFAMDLSRAVIVTPPHMPAREKKAVMMLVEEVQKRTGIRWDETNGWPEGGKTVILAGTKSEVAGVAGPHQAEVAGLEMPVGAEGFRLCARPTWGQSPVLLVVGNDARGVLFGVGRLLREMHLGRGMAEVQSPLDISTAPRYSLRGHQLGYRPKCNSYDAWDLPVWEQYFRDLAVFGCNAIELIPPRSDDDATSPHFPRPPMEMMQGMSRVADSYGLDVWVWYPAMDKDYSDAATVEAALKEWEEVYSTLSRIDAVFVPGGDPGHTQPKYLMALLEKQVKSLHRHHPAAQMWVSPQGFTREWMDEFLAILQRDQPVWLSGIVTGPQVRMSPQRLRELVPARYPIRTYPDITHSRQCQYPVPSWDRALAVTEGRECINPRPEDEATIFRYSQPGTVGFITYSEGCNDDFNKAVWSVLGWDPEVPVREIARQYSRYFVGDRYTENLADGVLGLERNWRGPLKENRGVEQTLENFRRMEREASPGDLKNWRFQQLLFRAYFDAYTQHRLKVEEEREADAMEPLGKARKAGSFDSMDKAERILSNLNGSESDPLRTRIFQLAEALFQSIGMQLSTGLYRAISMGRGNSLDTVDFPLNNRVWLKAQFERIRKLGGESERLAAINRIAHWTDPGPGGFYDDLGNSALQPHLVTGAGFGIDPASFSCPRVNFADEPLTTQPGGVAASTRRNSWWDHAEALYDAPLELRYTGLDSAARYRVRVVYGGDNYKRNIKLTANQTITIHPLIEKQLPIEPMEFAIPPEATRGGYLSLSWTAEPGLGGNGRACQISEVWLIRESKKTGSGR